jgi:hypothetical protein
MPPTGAPAATAAPTAIPPATAPPNAMPPTAMPPNPMPSTGMPSTGMPSTGMPSTGAPPAAVPPGADPSAVTQAFRASGPPPPPPGVAQPKPKRPSRRVLVVGGAAGAVVLVAGITTLVVYPSGGANAPTPSCAPQGCPVTRTVQAAPPQPSQKLKYRTVTREIGYFEGTIRIVNHTGRPMNTWTLSFTYPGAEIHNAWEAVLRQRGQNVVISNAATAAPIDDGDGFEVQFGGSGQPSTPTNCRLNDAPCTFVP